jgi:hypothetical protein
MANVALLTGVDEFNSGRPAIAAVAIAATPPDINSCPPLIPLRLSPSFRGRIQLVWQVLSQSAAQDLPGAPQLHINSRQAPWFEDVLGCRAKLWQFRFARYLTRAGPGWRDSDFDKGFIKSIVIQHIFIPPDIDKLADGAYTVLIKKANDLLIRGGQYSPMAVCKPLSVQQVHQFG